MKNTMWNFDDFKDKVALISDNDDKIYYEKLQNEADDLARIIGKRCLVFILCSNSIGSVVGYVGFMRNKIVPLLLSESISEEFLKNLTDTYHPEYIWMPEKQGKRYFEWEKVCCKFGYVLLKTNYKIIYPMHKELGQLITTSGSTGSPKLVRQSYTNICINVEQMVKYLRLDSMERPVTSVPMNYTYGCVMLNCHLKVGATILLTESGMLTRNFWEFVKKQKATSFDGVPYTYEMLAKIRFFSMELPYLRRMTEAGGKLLPELQIKFAQYAEKKNINFIIMYGSCEATAAMGYLPPEKALEKIGSCGVPVSGGKYELLDGQGDVISEQDTEGELVYYGHNVTMGYASSGEDLIKDDNFGDKLYNSDIAKRDKDGFYYIVGRKKRFLKIYGNRVSLDEIDRIIKEEFGYIECATTGKDDHLCVFVTDRGLIEKIRNYVSEKTKLNFSAFQVIYINEIPKNESGKILYNKLLSYL